MLTPDTLTTWLNDQAWPIAIILALVVGAYLTLKISARRRHAVLSRERAAVTESTFVSHLSDYGFDAVVTGTTYRYLQEEQRVQFPILPADALDEDLGLDSADVDQTVRELLVALKREQAPGLRHEPLVTVEDLVRHLQASPRRTQSIAA